MSSNSGNYRKVGGNQPIDRFTHIGSLNGSSMSYLSNGGYPPKSPARGGQSPHVPARGGGACPPQCGENPRRPAPPTSRDNFPAKHSKPVGW